jgi:hypothetical protein
VRLDFTVISSLTNATVNLLQTPQLGASWTTNASATFSTNLPGLSYGFTATNAPGAMFYRVELGP